jgi:hypothetical protein
MRLAAIALLALPGLLAPPKAALAEPIGEVDTVFKWIGPDHKIVVDAYDDPEVAGVTCYVSRAKTGGIKGAVGLAEDKAEASIACLQTGPISFAKPHALAGRDVQRAHLAGLQEAARGAHGGREAQCAGLPDLFRSCHRRLPAEQRHGHFSGSSRAHPGQVGSIVGTRGLGSPGSAPS